MAVTFTRPCIELNLGKLYLFLTKICILLCIIQQFSHPGGVIIMVVILLTNSDYFFFQISQLKKLGMEVCGHAFGRDFFASFGTDSGGSFAESNALQHKLLMFMDREFSC